MPFQYFSKNGKILPIEQAVIPVFNIEYSYGFGVYENIRVVHKTPYFLEQHTHRLLHSANVITLSHPFSEKQIQEYIYALLDTIEEDVYNLKILLIGGKTDEEVLLFILPLAPFFPEKKWYKQGISTITVTYERMLPQAKTLNMLGSFLTYKKAKEQGCYDALMVDHEGCIREGTRTNFLAVKENTIFIAPKEKILDGVTQQMVLHVAKKNGFSIEERNIQFSDLSSFDGVFLTSTSSKIMPIIKIDNFVYPKICPQIEKLVKLYDDFLKTCQGIFKANT